MTEKFHVGKTRKEWPADSVLADKAWGKLFDPAFQPHFFYSVKEFQTGNPPKSSLKPVVNPLWSIWRGCA